MISQLLQRARGFTLVEVLVYLAILVTVSSGGIILIISLDDVINEYRLETALYRSGTNVIEQIEVAVREADQLLVGSSVIASSTAGTLAIQNGGETTTFTKSGSDLLLGIDGINQGDLLSESVSVTTFTVYSYTTSVGTMVRVKLGLTATIGSSTKALTLYDGAVIRGDL